MPHSRVYPEKCLLQLVMDGWGMKHVFITGTWRQSRTAVNAVETMKVTQSKEGKDTATISWNTDSIRHNWCN